LWSHFFDTEAAAEAGSCALQHLDAEGDITLYALRVIAKGANGLVSVEKTAGSFGTGAGTGLAVGALIGLLGGPVGVVVGAAAGTMRDYWIAGVGPTEVEEDWVTPVDAAMEALGGAVIRRARMDAVQDQFDQDILAIRTEITGLEAECKHVSGAAQIRLQARLSATRADLAETTLRPKQKLADFKQERDLRVQAIEAQVARAQGKARSRLETRLELVRSAFRARSAKLSRAWGPSKEALSVQA